MIEYNENSVATMSQVPDDKILGDWKNLDGRKQFTYREYGFYQVCINLYLDGKIFDTYRLYKFDADKLVGQLENIGFTLGYTLEEIEEIFQEYQYMYKRRI